MRDLVNNLYKEKRIEESAYVRIIVSMDNIEYLLKCEMLKAIETKEYGEAKGIEKSLAIIRRDK